MRSLIALTVAFFLLILQSTVLELAPVRMAAPSLGLLVVLCVMGLGAHGIVLSWVLPIVAWVVLGSLVIALALSEGRLSAEHAFAAAQLDELFQLERWGEDPIAARRHVGIRQDIDAGARFLALLEDKRLKVGD